MVQLAVIVPTSSHRDQAATSSSAPSGRDAAINNTSDTAPNRNGTIAILITSGITVISDVATCPNCASNKSEREKTEEHFSRDEEEKAGVETTFRLEPDSRSNMAVRQENNGLQVQWICGQQ